MRTTAAAVQAVLLPGNDYDGTSSLEPFMAAANNSIDAYIVAVAQYKSVTVTSTLAELLERWLAAFFYKMSDQQYQSKNSGKSSASFRGTTGTDLSSNTYGVAVRMMDPYRVLAPLMEGRIASTVWLGKVPSEQIPYEQRN